MMEKRRSLFNLRTTQMSDDMYQHVVRRMSEMPQKTFREYAFRLIEQDMTDEKKQDAVYDEIQILRQEIHQGFQRLDRRLEQQTIQSPPPSSDRDDDVAEGQVVTDTVTGSIDEDYDLDF